MKFNIAWVRVAAQNVSLKVATITLTIIALAELLTIGSLAQRNPLIVERGCFSRTLAAKPADPTVDEIRAFLMDAIPLRFDTNAISKEGYLSIGEAGSREKEQATLKLRQIVQRVLVSDVKVDGNNITVMADRLLSVGKIRSVLPFNLKITVEETYRTETNAYGLILSSVSQIEEKEEK